MVGSSILQVPGSNKSLQFLKHCVKSVSFDMASPLPDGCWRMTTRTKPKRPASFSPRRRTCRSQNPSPSSGMSEDWLFNQKRNSTENRLRCYPTQTQEIASALSRNYRNLLRTHTGQPHPQSNTQASTAIIYPFSYFRCGKKRILSKTIGFACLVNLHQNPSNAMRPILT